MARNYRTRDIKTLFSLAAGRCSFAECRDVLVEWSDDPSDPVVTGQIGHIVGSSDDGPRPDPAMSQEDRDRYDNLILVCGKHHKLVDDKASLFGVDDLKYTKAAHERWVHDQLTESMDRFSVPELDVVCKAIEDPEAFPSTRLNAVPPQNKLDHNALTDKSAVFLQMGLLRTPAVSSYLDFQAANLDRKFPGRLRAGFVTEYSTWWDRGLRGDALFLALREFAGGGSNKSFDYQAAGLAVLAHLFQLCEVFEEPSDAPA